MESPPVNSFTCEEAKADLSSASDATAIRAPFYAIRSGEGAEELLVIGCTNSICELIGTYKEPRTYFMTSIIIPFPFRPLP